MAATRTKSAPSTNGSAAAKTASKAKEARDSVATAACGAKGPMLTAGATAAGLAGGFVLGSRLGSRPRGLGALLAPRRRVLGMPAGRKSGVVRTAEALGQVARELGSATNQVSDTTDDIRRIREQLDRPTGSHRSKSLDALTHRRGAHRRES